MLAAAEITAATATTGVAAVAWLVPALPLAGAALLLLGGRRIPDRLAGPIATLLAAAAAVISVALAVHLAGLDAESRRALLHLWTWFDIGSFEVDVGLLIDPLSVVMALVVTGIGALIHLYSIGYMHGDPGVRRYFAYLNLFLASMLVLVLASDLVVLFVGWELVGLCSYLLIGFWYERREFATAAKKAFVVNRVGDVAFMVGLFLTWTTVGSLAIPDVLAAAPELVGTGALLAITLLLLGGATGKSAQIPLLVWLPDAMAGPTPVSALIHAATMVTAGVYLIARLSPLYAATTTASDVVAWIGAATALYAALVAVRQDDIKRVLAYSTISQLGFMFLAVGVGAYSAGIFHLVTHAFFKALLFLGAGAVMHALGNEQDIWRMGGLRRALPITTGTALVAWLAIAGVPPLSGFWSKDHILTAAYESGAVAVWAIGLVAATLTAFYMTRWFVLVFLGRPRHDPALHPHEAPTTMTVPLVVLAIGSAVAGGLLDPTKDGPLSRWLAPSVVHEEIHAGGALSEGVLIALSVLAALIGIAAAWWAYHRDPVTEPIQGRLATWAARGFGLDAFYETVFVRGGRRVVEGLAWFDRTIIDGTVEGLGVAARGAGRLLRGLQTGYARGYLAALGVGAAAVLIVLVVQG